MESAAFDPLFVPETGAIPLPDFPPPPPPVPDFAPDGEPESATELNQDQVFEAEVEPEPASAPEPEPAAEPEPEPEPDAVREPEPDPEPAEEPEPAPVSPTAPHSEDEVLARIFPLLPTGIRTLTGPGDDCAVLSASSHTLISTDVLVEGEHFRTDWSSGFDIGWRSIMQNAADISAMGGTPHSYVIAMTVPQQTEVAWLEDFSRGVAAAIGDSDAGVVGGDLTRGPILSVAVTVLGQAPGQIVHRSGARPGDALVLAGTLGHSAAGLAALERWGTQVQHTSQATVDIYRRPNPPLEAGPKLAALGATAMLDVSDGLVRDAQRLATASGVSIDLDSQLLQPFVGQLEALIPGADPWQWVLHGGEDHALLASLPARQVKYLDEGCTVIGQVVARVGAAVTLDGAELPGLGGWDHFAH